MKQWLEELSKKASSTLGVTKLKLEKNAPDLLVVAGVIGVVGTVVLACRETLRAHDILEEHEESLNTIREASRIQEEQEILNDYEETMEGGGDIKEGILISYPPETQRRDKVITYLKTGGKFVKLYAPSVALGGVSLGFILYSHKLLKDRYLMAISAFNAVSAAYETYRSRVRSEMGEEYDRHILTGSSYELVEKDVVNEKGKKKTTTEEVETVDQEAALGNPYARWFDETNPNYDQNRDFCLMFLRAQQQILQDRLDARGYLFLNEVWDALGMECSQVGALVGWVKRSNGDGFVDLGIYDPKSESARQFVNGKGNAILLNPNVDGVIWDKLERKS